MNMRKNMMKVALVAAVAAMAGYGVYAHQTKEMMSDVMLENVEALATGESSDGNCRTNEDYTAICNYYDKGAICPCGF